MPVLEVSHQFLYLISGPPTLFKGFSQCLGETMINKECCEGLHCCYMLRRSWQGEMYLLLYLLWYAIVLSRLWIFLIQAFIQRIFYDDFPICPWVWLRSWLRLWLWFWLWLQLHGCRFSTSVLVSCLLSMSHAA